MMKKIPLRKCLATGEQCPKKDLFRIVRTPEGDIKIDPTGKMNGRGAYIKKSAEAIALASKKRVLDRQLEREIPDSIYEALLALIK